MVSHNIGKLIVWQFHLNSFLVIDLCITLSAKAITLCSDNHCIQITSRYYWNTIPRMLSTYFVYSVPCLFRTLQFRNCVQSDNFHHVLRTFLKQTARLSASCKNQKRISQLKLKLQLWSAFKSTKNHCIS